MEREYVDHATLGVHGERNLRGVDPAGHDVQIARKRLVQSRVTRIQQPIELAVGEAQSDVESDFESRRNNAHGPRGDVLEVASFDE